MQPRNIISLLLLLPMLSAAQKPKKIIYAELGPPGGLLSVNYDVRFKPSSSGLGFRAGAGMLFDFYNLGYALPVALNYVAGREKNFFEAGTGASLFHFKETNQDSWFNFKKETFVAPFVWLGYRYQPTEKRFTFRAGVCQFLNDFNLPTVFGIPSLYPSLSFGYALP